MISCSREDLSKTTSWPVFVPIIRCEEEGKAMHRMSRELSVSTLLILVWS